MKFEHIDVSIRPSLSSLPLQMTLFYNCVYSVIFAILLGAALINKVSIRIFRLCKITSRLITLLQVKHYDSAFGLAVFCIWAATEPVRLYYGIAGNLQESVSFVYGFFFDSQLTLITAFVGCASVNVSAYDNIPTACSNSVLGLLSNDKISS